MRRDWSSLAFPIERVVVVTRVGAVGGGGWAAAGDGLGVAALGAGWVLACVSCPSMMKGTGRAGGMFQGVSGRGVSKWVAVGRLGISVSLRGFLDLARL